MAKRNHRARFSKSKNKLYEKTQRSPSPRRDSHRSLNPYVIRMDRIRADEAQSQFWNRFRHLEKQGLIPQWLWRLHRRTLFELFVMWYKA